MKLRIGTFNLFQFVEPPFSWYVKKDTFKQDDWQQKCQWIKKQIKSMDCDIIGFQEVFSIESLKELLNTLGYSYFKTLDIPKLKNKTTYTSTIVAIASKYPIKDIQKVPLYVATLKQHHFQGHFQFSRQAIKALIDLPNNEEVTLYVTHLKSNRLNEFEYRFTKHDTLEEKKARLKTSLESNFSPSLKQRLCEASSLYHDIKKQTGHTVLVCDLNDKEFSITIDALTNREYHIPKKGNKLLLLDAHYFFKPEVYNPHPEAKKAPRTATSYYQSKGNVLDYIFVSPSLIPYITSYEIHDKHLKKNQNGSLQESDHAQVVCEFTIKEIVKTH